MIETRSRRKLLLFLLCISLLGYASAQTTLDGLHDSIKKVLHLPFEVPYLRSFLLPLLARNGEYLRL